MIKRLLILFLALASSSKALTFDQYGGLIGASCPARAFPYTITRGRTYQATISSISCVVGTCNITLSSATTWYAFNAIIISGTGNTSINTPSGQVDFITSTTPTYTTSPPSSTSLSITTSRANGLSATQGTVLWAGWYSGVVTDGFGTKRWVVCTPNGNAMFMMGITQVDPGGSPNGSLFKGFNGANLLSNRYGTDLAPSLCGPTTNITFLKSCFLAQDVKDFNFNVLLEGANSHQWAWDLEPGACNVGWCTSDNYPPAGMLLPAINNNFLTQYTSGNVLPFVTTTPKDYAVLYKAAYNTLFTRGWVDDFDPQMQTWFNQCMASQVTCMGQYSNRKNNSYRLFYLPDESDEGGKFHSDAGKFLAVQQIPGAMTPPYLHTVTGTGELQGGLQDLIVSPYGASVKAGVLKGSRPFTNLVYPDQLVHIKQILCDWLSGGVCSGSLYNSTIAVSASGNGTTTTYTGNFDDGAGVGLAKYRPGELISVTSCSAFNTPTGSSDTVTVVSVNGVTSFTTAQAVSGSASGCTVFDGPAYPSISALNTAWGSSFTQWATGGTFFVNSFASGDGTTTTFGPTILTHTNVAPCTLQVFVNGALVGGDFCDGPRASSPTQIGTLYAWGGGSPPLLTWAPSGISSGLPTGASIALGTAIKDSNGNIQVCSTAGTIGATQPTWNSGNWSTTADNTVVWTLVPPNVLTAASQITENTGSLTLTFTVAPPAGTNNITVSHEAGGGWGLDHAFVDEDGSIDSGAAWFPPTQWDSTLVGSTQVEKDLTNFLLVDSFQYLRIQADVLRAWQPSVMFEPFTFGASDSPSDWPTLKACDYYCDAIEFGQIPAMDINNDIPDDQARFDFVGQYYTGPIFSQVIFMAQPDSWGGTPFSIVTGSVPLSSTQAQRATLYATGMGIALNTAYSAGCNCSQVGVVPTFGQAYFGVYDDASTNNNFGWETPLGDRYDGVQASDKISFDRFGYQHGYFPFPSSNGKFPGENLCGGTTSATCTGQPVTYGNFTKPASGTNFSWITLFPMIHTNGGLTGGKTH